ncbi:MAG: hypothetical protein U0Z53_07855 [Blastocatellia bacterium]
MRGAAVLGILLINILDWPALEPAAIRQQQAGQPAQSLGYWFVNQILFEGKECVQSSRCSRRERGTADCARRRAERRTACCRHCLRRTLWLILFGVLHAYFIWWGDILYFYGIVGLMLFPLRRASPKWLLAAGVLLVLISSAKSVWGDYDNLSSATGLRSPDRNPGQTAHRCAER